MAMLIQSLSAKLGIATGNNLAEQCRMNFPRPVVISMWVLMELVAMATDLAEFLGAALGFNLLFGIPLWLAGILTAIATFLILGLERYGFRPLEAVITALVAVVAVSYLVETILDRPAWNSVLFHAVVPQFSGTESVLLATGILGATVMPHAIFLHSALTQNRIVVREPAQLRRLFRFEIIDVVIAMGVASLINAAMLIMAASTFFYKGMTRSGRSRKPTKPCSRCWAGRRNGLCHLAAGLRAFLLFGRHDGRPGDHAGLPALPHPALGPPAGDDGSFADRDRHRARSHPHPGAQPGRAQLRPAVCHHPAGHVHQPAGDHGRAGQPPVNHRSGRRGGRRHRLSKPVSALPDFLRKVKLCSSICWFPWMDRSWQNLPCQ